MNNGRIGTGLSTTVLGLGLGLGLGLVPVLSAPAAAQTAEEAERLERGARVVEVEFGAPVLRLTMGETAALPEVRLLDARGNEVDAMYRAFASGAVVMEGDSLRATEGGEGTWTVLVMTPADFEGRPAIGRLEVLASWPEVTRVAVDVEPGTLYAGTSLRHRARALHGSGSERPEVDFSWRSSDPSVAEVDAYGTVLARQPGRVTITAGYGDVVGSVEHRVQELPARDLVIDGGATEARTGDVLAFEARALDGRGRGVDDVPITWSYTYIPDDTIKAPGAVAEVRKGMFVGEEPGVYTVLAQAGPLTARRTVKLRPRDVVRAVETLGQGEVTHVHTSDIWPFEGLDGRDYAVTGTWGGDGWAYFWDITEPGAIVKVDSIQVDARTVNDVKVSPDGRYAALSREGASNRRNGVVIIDLANPREPEIASIYDQGLTGGVHNMFAQDDYLFALSGGDKYVILDVTDIRNPRYVSEYDHPNSRVHDVWVRDGLAYSSEWGQGVVVVDVGDGRWGGSIENPVFVTNFPVPTGATHAALPYHQEETGKVYLILGDEIMRRTGLAWAGTGVSIPTPGSAPASTTGYVHIVDFTDPESPEYVARYEAEEYGTHNMWVEDDILYQAYYEGGMRMVDLSGPLMGDLKAQRREIAVFKPFDPDGYVANAPMVWGGFTHKGNLFLSDFNSGLWAVKLEPKAKPAT